MTESAAARRTNVVLIGIFVAALVNHAWWVTRNWASPFMPGHEFRQTQTAIIAYFIDRQDDFSLLYETPIVGKPWVSILMEVPVYEWTVVGLSRWTGWSHQVAARTTTLGCFYLTLPAVFLLLGRWRVPPARRTLALALILVCPVYIFYSRSFLMDSMSLLGSAWFLLGYIRMMDERRWYWFMLATVAGTLTALVKSATLAIWLWPAAGYVAWMLCCEFRVRAGWGALAQTVFWGLAGVTVPLGMLRLWILLTDPLKLAHSSAWIFASGNLVGGNWGLNDLRARFAPAVWSTLADRWREAVMPPWLLVGLLVAGLVFLPRVRRLALGLVSLFFLAQLLFPYAYAYQEYYFYSCAVFLSAGLACLFFGLLDSKAPRWLCWLLLAVPFFAQLNTYRVIYYPGQIARSEGGVPYTRALRDFLPKESVIIVSGNDWSSIIPYYSQRKALMIRNGLEYDSNYLNRAFSELMDEDVGALVLVGSQRENRALVERASVAFGIDLHPSFSSERVDVYCSVLYRDRVKDQLRNAGNYDGLKNEAPVMTEARRSRPFRVFPATAHNSFPAISPAPIRAYFDVGLGYIWLGAEKAIFAHPNADLWIRPTMSATRIEWEYGVQNEALEGDSGYTDGVEFVLTGVSAGTERLIFRRFLDPKGRAEDRGRQKLDLSYQPRPGEILHFATRPGPGSAFDWAYWARIDVH